MFVMVIFARYNPCVTAKEYMCSNSTKGKEIIGITVFHNHGGTKTRVKTDYSLPIYVTYG